MKKIIAILLLVALVLCGCGTTDSSESSGQKSPTSCTLSDCDDESATEGSTETISLDPKDGYEAFENAFKALKAVDKEGISCYFGSDFWQWSFDVGEGELALIKRALPQMEYEFIGFEESEDGTIFGTVKVKAIDLGLEYLDVQLRLEDWYQAMALEDLPITDEGKANELFRIFNSELDDVSALKYHEATISLEAYCLDDKWYVSRSDELLRAIFGTVTWGYGMG